MLNGTLDWVTSWDIADVVMIMARTDQADVPTVVSCFLPAGRADVATPGLEVGELADRQPHRARRTHARRPHAPLARCRARPAPE
jgi:alkylation response protein AidB-like acyl-CoA dehydrogenase